MSIYDHKDYKVYVNEWVKSLPKQGHGEFRKLSLHLGVSTTMISQVFRGEKHLSLEMAYEIGEFIGLNDDEIDYFLLLVEYNRAGSHKLEKQLLKQIVSRQNKAKKLENRIRKDVELSEEVKTIYYSNWYYCAVWILSSIDGFDDVTTIAKKLNMTRQQTQKIVDFLLENQLCRYEKNKLTNGSRSTFISANHPLVTKHHMNFRSLGLNKMALSDDESLFFTGPMSVSKNVAEKIRQELPNFIEQIKKLVGSEEPEVSRCLNIDYFEI